MKRTHLAVAATAAASAVLVASPQLTVAATPTPAAAPVQLAAAPSGRLTNLAHLDFLGDTFTPPAQAGHTTYQIAQRPALGTLWTYADRRPGGTFAAGRRREVRPGHEHLGPGRLQRRRPRARRGRLRAGLEADRLRAQPATPRSRCCAA